MDKKLNILDAAIVLLAVSLICMVYFMWDRPRQTIPDREYYLPDPASQIDPFEDVIQTLPGEPDY